MGSIRAIIGDHIINKGKTKVDGDSLFGPGRFVGLYFSAHWCPPCRSFTPELAKWYTTFKATAAGQNFDIIFVSSDRDDASFESYFEEMPWLALDFKNRDAKVKLSKTFKVQGIPTLLILDGENGELITDQGRRHVAEDPEAAQFPWRPKSLEEIFYSGKFIKNDNSEVSRDELQGSVVGIYFSAHWCSPCRDFTPRLVETYNKIRQDGKKFQIVFCSADRNEAAFQEYFSEMPWLAIPHGDPRIDELNSSCDVDGIPTLVLIDENNKMITASGRSEAEADPQGLNFPWPPKAVNEFTPASADKLNDSASLVLFTDGSETSMEAAKAALKDSAERHFAKGDSQELFFFYAGTGQLVEGLCQFANLSADERPLLAIVDVQESKKYVATGFGSISKEAVDSFVLSYEAGELESESIR